MAPNCPAFSDFRMNEDGLLKCRGEFRCQCASADIDVPTFKKQYFFKLKDKAFSELTDDDRTDIHHMFAGHMKPHRKEFDGYDMAQYFAENTREDQMGFSLMFPAQLDSEMKKILRFKELGYPENHEQLWNRVKSYF